jgi:hypothetical protein
VGEKKSVRYEHQDSSISRDACPRYISQHGNEPHDFMDWTQEREDFFAKSLRVADGGQYRNDWPAAMDRVIRENETLRAQVAAHEDADRRWSADMAELRDELRAERDFRAQMVADRDARSGEPQ